MKVEFVSYDGKYPNLCSGRLILRVDGAVCEFPRYCLTSGGRINSDGSGDMWPEAGKWSISEWPEDFPEELKQEAVDVVNASVKHGCCGGCV